MKRMADNGVGNDTDQDRKRKQREEVHNPPAKRMRIIEEGSCQTSQALFQQVLELSTPDREELISSLAQREASRSTKTSSSTPSSSSSSSQSPSSLASSPSQQNQSQHPSGDQPSLSPSPSPTEKEKGKEEEMVESSPSSSSSSSSSSSLPKASKALPNSWNQLEEFLKGKFDQKYHSIIFKEVASLSEVYMESYEAFAKDTIENLKKIQIHHGVRPFLEELKKVSSAPAPAPGFEIAKYVEQLMPSKNGKRRVSLEAEKERLPETLKRKNLGVYLKFVNRERSINELLKHAVIYYQNYFMGSSDEKECPFPACSGGPGLGKTTFCRKAFTKAIDAPAEGEEAQIMWDGVPSDFKEVVECCVEQGRQYRISYASPAIQPAEYQKENWARSFAFRLGVVYAKSQKTFPLEWDKLPTGSLLVEAVIKQITGSKKEAMIVVNLDETNVLLSHTDGVQYLKGVLGVVKEFNRKGFGFVYVILSGTNVKTLNEMLRDSSSGTHPVEIPLPLLEDHHVNEVLYDLARRSCGKEMQKKSSQALDFVIGVLGGVPRYVEMLVFLIGSNGKDFLTDRYSEVLYSEEFPAHDILEKVKETISALYGSTYTTTVASIQRPRALLAYSLFGWYVMRDEALFGVKTVAELESLGVVFLQGVEPAATLRLPLILLLFISNSTFSSRELPMLLKHFTVLVSPQESERVMFAIIWLKCAARIECGDLVRVDDLFPINKFPCLNPFWAKCSFTLDPNCILRDCTTRIYQNNWESVFQQFRATGALIVNGAGAPFADLILIPKDGAFAIFFQEKQREKAKQKNLSAQKIPTLALATVLSEHQKCEVETPHLFVMNTDEGFAEQSQLADNEVVLSCQDHVDLMGKLLSQLRLFNSIQSKPLIISEDP